jgi:hypothetical protein
MLLLDTATTTTVTTTTTPVAAAAAAATARDALVVSLLANLRSKAREADAETPTEVHTETELAAWEEATEDTFDYSLKMNTCYLFFITIARTN